jgi:predicted PurR-regulated permease PerM
MPIFGEKRDRAVTILVVLGVALFIALAPYATGLLAIPVLYVVFEPVHQWLVQRMQPRLAATLVVLLVLVAIVAPGLSFAGMVVRQAQQIAGSVLQSPFLGRLAELHVGSVDVGSQLADMGSKVVSFIGSSAFGLIGTATRLALHLTIALFGLFYLLLAPATTWEAVQPYIPFSAKNTEKLRTRFRDVTTSTIIGTGLAAAIQGTLVGIGFWATGLSNGVFWGVVTMVFGILPVVGSGLVWGPGAIALALSHRYTAAVGLFVWGAIVVGNVDYVIRPIVFRRWANIHPLITLVGALAGVPYFGILGLLIGPLALSYFFELLKMYHEEYLA